MRKGAIQEWWDVRDRQGQKTGEVRAKGSSFSEGEYHLAMEAWIVDSRGRLLVQQRSEGCELLPGIWGLTTGRMISGEESREGCQREIREELGLPVSPDSLTFLTRIPRGELLWDLYLVRCDAALSQLKLQKEEVAQVRWVTPEEFLGMLEEGLLYHYPEIKKILSQVLSLTGT